MSGSFGIIFSKDCREILLVKRRDMPMWVLPGGKIEKNESPEDAAIREVFEETGYKVNIIRKTAEYYYPKKEKTNHIYECIVISGVKTLSNESKEIVEFDVGKLPAMTHPHIGIYIKDALEYKKDTIKKELYGYGIVFLIKVIVRPWFLLKFFLRKIGTPWNT